MMDNQPQQAELGSQIVKCEKRLQDIAGGKVQLVTCDYDSNNKSDV